MSEQTIHSPNVEQEKPWWDDPALPWAHEPTKADLWCWSLLSLAAVYGLVMIPLRAWLLTLPYVAAWVNGSRTAMGAIGALTATQPDPHLWWLWALLAATVSGTKWDLVYWWAGRLWGSAIVDTFTGQRPRLRRLSAALVRFTQRRPGVALMLTYLPIPGVAVVCPAAGMAGVSLRRFWFIDLFWCFCFQLLYLGVGYWIGEPAVKALVLYAKYANYVVIVLLIVMLATMWRRNRRAHNDGGTLEDPAVA